MSQSLDSDDPAYRDPDKWSHVEGKEHSKITCIREVDSSMEEEDPEADDGRMVLSNN